MLVHFRWKNERGEWQQQDMMKKQAVEIISGGFSDGHTFLTSKATEEGTIPMTLTFIHETGQAEVFDENTKQRLLNDYPTWAIKTSTTTERGRCTTIGPKKYVDDLDELD